MYRVRTTLINLLVAGLHEGHVDTCTERAESEYFACAKSIYIRKVSLFAYTNI